MNTTNKQTQNTINRPPFLSFSEDAWVKEQMSKLTLEQKIGQLLHVAAYSNRDQAHTDYLQQLLEEEHIGGLIFFQGNPIAQATMTNRLQSKSKVPLLISIDGEWGLAMRLNDTIAFPYQLALGAISHEKTHLIYEMGRSIGKQCKALGIHVNFAPSIDINNNPANPVIGFRSFGEDKHLVTEKALAYMKGMQDEGVLACAKHFPGHGDTDSDSHFELPLITHSKEHLVENELYPFQKLLEEGIGSIMTAHLNVPALETTNALPATLSKAIASDLLKSEMGFEGLVFTDALDMKGVSAAFKPGDIEMKALAAGNDVLLFTVDVPKAKQRILEAVEEGRISEEQIEQSCYKQLLVKKWVGLDKWMPANLNTLEKDLQSEEAIQLNVQLAEEAITEYSSHPSFKLINTDDDTVLVNLFGDPEAEVKLVKAFDASLLHHFKGKNSDDKLKGNTLFTNLLKERYTSKIVTIDFNSTNYEETLQKVKSYKKRIIALHLTGMKTASGFGITEVMHQFVGAFTEDVNTQFVLFGNIYGLNVLKGLKQAKNLLLCYQDSKEMQRAAYQVIIGENLAKGKLPVKIN